MYYEVFTEKCVFDIVGHYKNGHVMRHIDTPTIWCLCETSWGMSVELISLAPILENNNNNVDF